MNRLIRNDWVEVVDKNHIFTIEDFGYDTGVKGPITLKHCEKCVSVNKCWFKNEKNKKPEPNKILGINFVDDIINEITPGLYHYKCHCTESPITTPTTNQIELVIPTGKLNYLFTKKQGWLNYMGYFEQDYDDFIEIFKEQCKYAYRNGNYSKIDHSKYGFKINLAITIPGKNQKQSQIFSINSGYTIFPQGKLKLNTPLGGWTK